MSEKDDVEKNRAERKAVAIQGLLKEERAKRIRSPEPWLKYINELVANNKLEIARMELKEFKNTYPDYTVPSELTDLLKQQ